MSSSAQAQTKSQFRLFQLSLSLTYLEFLVGVALVAHHGAVSGGEDGVSVEINNTVMATSKQVPSKERDLHNLTQNNCIERLS